MKKISLKKKILLSVFGSAIILSGAIVGTDVSMVTRDSQTNTILQKIKQNNNLLNHDLAVNSSANMMANYQAKEYDLLKNTPITSLNLIGSHDSGMYTTRNSLGNDASGAPKWLFNHGSSEEVKKLATMQSQDIYSQLENGVRYLNLRISNPEGSNNFNINNIYTTHTVLGASIVSVVNQVAQFIAQNPNELIILDFNHWYAGNGDNAALQTSVANYLWQAFGNTNNNLINQYNPSLKGSHLAKNTNQYQFDQPFSNFIKLNSPTNKNIIVTFANSWVSNNFIQSSYNNGSISNINYDAQHNQSSIISYWTEQFHWQDIIKLLGQFKQIEDQSLDNIYVKQAIPNWDSLLYIAGYFENVYGYQMDYWWDTHGHVLKYIETQDNHGGVILVNNAGTDWNFKNWIYMNPAYSDSYNQSFAKTISFKQPNDWHYKTYDEILEYVNQNKFLFSSLRLDNTKFLGKVVIDSYNKVTHELKFHFNYLNKYPTKEFTMHDIYENIIKNVHFKPTNYLQNWISWNYNNYFMQYGFAATTKQFRLIVDSQPWNFYSITVNNQPVSHSFYINFIKSIQLKKFMILVIEKIVKHNI